MFVHALKEREAQQAFAPIVRQVDLKVHTAVHANPARSQEQLALNQVNLKTSVHVLENQWESNQQI